MMRVVSLSVFVVTASHEHGTGGFGKCDSWRCAGIPISQRRRNATRARDIGRPAPHREITHSGECATIELPCAAHRNDLRLGVQKKQLSAIYRAKTKRTQEHLCSVALWNTL